MVKWSKKSQQLNGKIFKWPKWPNVSIVEWPKGQMVKWAHQLNGKIVEWSNGRISKWSKGQIPDQEVRKLGSYEVISALYA